MKLQHRLARLALGVLALGVCLHLALLVGYEQVTYRERLQQDLRGRTAVLGLNSAAALAFKDARAALENLQTLNATRAVTLACLYDEHRSELARYAPGGEPCPTLPPHSGRGDRIRQLDPVQLQGQPVGYILVEERLPTLGERLTRYGLLLVSALAVEAILVIVLVGAVRARVVGPVQRLAGVAATVSAQPGRGTRVVLEGDDEIAALGRAANSMLDTIEAREAALRETARLLQALIDHAPATITVKDMAGRYLLANTQFAQLTGRATDALPGLTDADLFPPAEVAAHALADAEACRDDSGRRTEEQLGGRTWLVERFALRTPERGLFAVAAMATDISEQRAMQASLADALARLQQLNDTLEARVQARSDELERAMTKLVHSEKLAALGSLVAGIAHELNTPVGLVVTNASTLSARAQEFGRLVLDNRISRSALQAFVQDIETGAVLIERSATRAGRLIHDFKQLAVDQTSMRRRPFMLDAVIGDTLNALVPLFKHSAHRVTHHAGSPVACEGFPGALEQILTNLVQNALLHGLGDQAPGLIEIEASEDGGRVTLTVQDTGRGIAPHALAQVFDPFFTTRMGDGGSGLGLYIVHNLVTGLLGGTVEAANRPEGGARFTVRFPAVAPERRHAPRPAA